MGAWLMDQVLSSFGELLRNHGFVQTSELSDAKHFGNEMIVFESDELRLQFIKDRDEVSADVAPARECNEWFQLPRLLESFSDPVVVPFRVMSFREQASGLESNYAK